MASIRPAAVAGMFYPGEPRALAAEVARFLGGGDAEPAPRLAFPKALVVPHAGYVYSGAVAARAYQELSAARGVVRRVVLLGPAHRVPVRGLAAPGVDAFETPLGTVPLDRAALRSLAWIDFYRGRWNDAYREASKYVHDTEAKEPDAAYVVILGTLALRRDARPRDADAFLREWQPKLDASRWPAPVTAYLLGGDARILLAAAREPGERTEARTYLAVDLLAQGKRAEGVKLLQEVLRDGEPGYMEYDAAYHELRRLGLAQPADRRRRR